MNRYTKNKIISNLHILNKKNQQIKNAIIDNKSEKIKQLLCECQNIAINTGNIIEASSDCQLAIQNLENYCEEAYLIYTQVCDGNINYDPLPTFMSYIDLAEECINNIKIKTEVVFCPYKASMWDSFESIWVAASEDDECDVFVVAIPYYDRKPDKTVGGFHYEGDKYPKNVHITHYNDYNFSLRHPDLIYIHNPYDGGNYVTSVDARFYSDELKKYTECLVYVPYFVAGYYADEKRALNNIPLCINNVDVVVLQSEQQKMALSFNGMYDTKMAVLGSPKIDKALDDGIVIPENLASKIGDKKVLLLNTSISKVLRDENWADEMQNIFDAFEKDDSFFAIWRPHPLLAATINAMRPDQKQKTEDFMCKVQKMNNVFIDTYDDAYVSMKVSDCMISDYSSLIMQYTATGKPTLVLDGSASYRKTKIVCCDYFSNYFVNDGETYESFFKMIKSGCDYKKTERMRYFKESVVNADGSCGRKVHDYIKRIIRNKYI